MKVDELRAEVDRRLGLGLKFIMLVLARECSGHRARVFPGVLGEVVSVNSNGHTVVSVPLDKVDAYLTRAGVPRNNPPAESVS